jgi:hypothetical protein
MVERDGGDGESGEGGTGVVGRGYTFHFGEGEMNDVCGGEGLYLRLWKRVSPSDTKERHCSEAAAEVPNGCWRRIGVGDGLRGRATAGRRSLQAPTKFQKLSLRAACQSPSGQWASTLDVSHSSQIPGEAFAGANELLKLT